MNPSDTNAPEAPPMLTDLLYRHCLNRDGQPSDHSRGLRAGLRKLLSPATVRQGQFALGTLGAGSAVGCPAGELVAGLFALYPHRTERPRNFGTTCRDLAHLGGQKPGDSAFDRHFRRILAARTLDDLLGPVLHAGRKAKAEGVGIYYYRLYNDLRDFHQRPDEILERWVKSYFQTREPGEDPTE